MSIFTKLMYEFNAISIKIPAIFAIDIDKKLILKFILEGIRSRVAKPLIKKQSTSRNHPTQSYDILCSYNNKDCIVLLGKYSLFNKGC